MAYPSLPQSYLHPSALHSHTTTTHSRSSGSASASSVEPITPEMVHNTSVPLPTNMHLDPGLNVTSNGDDQIECKWKGCDFYAPSPDALYDHLCNQHVGRKSTNNLCLTCAWEGCGVKCVKRDHITSHLRGEF